MFSTLGLSCNHRLRLLCLGQVVCELLERGFGQLVLWPEVRGQVGEGARYGLKGCLG